MKKTREELVKTIFKLNHVIASMKRKAHKNENRLRKYLDLAFYKGKNDMYIKTYEEWRRGAIKEINK